MTFPAVEGIVRVVSVVGVRNCVAVPRIAGRRHPQINNSFDDRPCFCGKKPDTSRNIVPPRQQIDGNFLIQTIRGGKSVVHQNLCGAKGKAPAAGLIGNF